MPGDSPNVRTKSRQLAGPNLGERVDRFVDTRPPPYETSVSFGTPTAPPGTQITVSEGHPFRSRKRGGKEDIGGEFFTSKSEMEPCKMVSFDGFRTEQSDGSYGWNYSGPCLPFDPYVGPTGNGLFPGDISSSNDDLDEAGAEAIARIKPTNSVADLSVALGELIKDGLPSIVGSQTWKDRAQHSRNAGGEYLNVQFGWVPLVSDVRKTMHAVQNAKAVMEQFERDAGKVVRRRYSFPTERNSSRLVLGEVSGPFGPTNPVMRLGSEKPVIVLNSTVEQSRWFSGAFTYHLPTGYNSRKAMDGYAAYADRVLGLNLDPDNLWNLAPWSWAIDWFTNTGDVLSNVVDTAKYGLVMQYGYMMETTIRKDTYTLEGGSEPNRYGFVQPLTFTTTVKKRRKANPFGFGVSFADLSSAQQAILVALGLSRR